MKLHDKYKYNKTKIIVPRFRSGTNKNELNTYLNRRQTGLQWQCLEPISALEAMTNLNRILQHREI
jgi:hypothetical protein